jgi:hypothetical protein
MSVDVIGAMFEACSDKRKLILALLALSGEPMGRRRIHEHLLPLGDSAVEDDLAERPGSAARRRPDRRAAVARLRGHARPGVAGDRLGPARKAPE